MYVGYDASMIFVNASLEVTLQRNKERERKIPEDVITQAWHGVQENIGKFQALFGSNNFLVIDNNKPLDKEEIERLKVEMTRKAMKMLNAPLENKTGIKILNILNESGGLYLSDLSGVDFSILKKFKA
jgi:predicted kinase